MSKINWKLETNIKNKSAKNSSIDKGIGIVEQKSKELPIYKGIELNQ